MSWLDFVVLAVISFAALIGFRIGIIKAILSLVSVIGGVILAERYYVPLSEWLTFISEPNIAKIAAFVIIIIAVMIIAAIVASLLKFITSLMMLGWVNRLGGAVFGLLLGGTICSAGLAAWVNFIGMSETIGNSDLVNLLLNYFPLVLALLPDEFDAIRSFFQQAGPFRQL